MAKTVYTSLYLVIAQMLVLIVEDGVSKIDHGGYDSLTQDNLTSKTSYNELFHVRKRYNYEKLKKMLTIEETKLKKINASLFSEAFIFAKESVKRIIQRHSSSVISNSSNLPQDDQVEMDETISIFFSEKERIDGFKRTRPEENPYALMLVIVSKLDKLSMCSGSLVSRNRVLTAAHCFHPFPKKVYVYAGGNSLNEITGSDTLPSSGQVIESKSFFPHPKYTVKAKFEFDVAVVHLPKPFRLTKYVKTVEIMSRAWTKGQYKACMVTGFGVLQKGEKSTLDHTRKTHYLEVKTPCVCSEVEEEDELFVCSKPKEDFGVCEGDSGSGLICDGRVVAVTTGFMNFLDFDECDVVELKDSFCAKNTTVHFFTQINPHLKWIEATIKRSSGHFALPSFLLVVIIQIVILFSS